MENSQNTGMQKAKNTLVAIGVVAVVLFIILLVIGIKVVSTVLVYIVGTLAVLALIGFAVYYLRKWFGKKE